MPSTTAYKYLLDTNIVSALVRDPGGLVMRHVARAGEDKVCTSIIVACELRFGAAKKGSPKLAEQVEQVLSVLPVLALEADADHRYGALRAGLERAGTPIGANDTLIATRALSLGLTLVTDNVDEFRRVKGLTLRSWLAR
jgi:tRNA(fMet)-specific endonuclease VapC